MRMRHRRCAHVAAVVVAFVFSACADTAGTTSLQTSVGATRLVVDPSQLTFAALGATKVLTAASVREDGATLGVAGLSWRSSDAHVAIVDANGTVRAVGNGSALIVASDGERADTAVARVQQEVVALEVAPHGVQLVVGDSVRIQAAARDRGGAAVADPAIGWRSLSPAVAVVDSTGLLRATGPGHTHLIAASAGALDTVGVTVLQAARTMVVVSPTAATLAAIGDTIRLSASASDAMGLPLSAATVAWASLEPSVASVSVTGIVRAQAAGTARIVASVGGAADTATIRVVPTPASLSVAPALDTIHGIGDTVQFSAAVRDANGNPVAGATPVWTSANPAIASVDATGRVTARAFGTTRITVALPGVGSASATVLVSANIAQIELEPATATLAPGGALTFTATALDARGVAVKGVAFRWSTSDGGVAMVSATGVLTAVAAGTATITAEADGVSATARVTVSAPSGQPGSGSSPQMLTVEPSGIGSGRVDSAPAGISCVAADGVSSGACAASFPADANVTLTPTADEGSTFSGWSGACTGTGACVVAMDQAKTVGAGFAQQPPPLTVNVAPASLELQVGQTAALSATVAGGDVDQPRTVAWSSSAPAVATVDASGNVTAIGIGSAVITAAATADSTVRGIVTVSVSAPSPPPPTGPITVSVSPTSVQLQVGESSVLAAVVSGTAAGQPTTVSWNSSAPAVATVDANGNVTAVAAGAATITATSVADPSASASASVAVTSGRLTLAVTGAGSGAGTVTSSPAGVNCSLVGGASSGSCSASFAAGTVVTLTAAPAAGDTFDGWTGACTGTGSCALTLVEARSVRASFSARVAPPTSSTTPTVTALPASSITGGGADLNAMIDGNGGDYLLWFEWTTDPAMATGITKSGAVTNTEAGATNAQNIPWSVRADGLAASTTYYFRVVASNSKGTITGPIASFVTGAATAPAILGESSTDVYSTSATLTATVDPNGAPITLRYQYGYQPDLSDAADGSSTTGDLAVRSWTATLQSLTPGRTVYFRWVASNSAGSTLGAIRSLATLQTGGIPARVEATSAIHGGTPRARALGPARPRIR